MRATVQKIIVSKYYSQIPNPSLAKKNSGSEYAIHNTAYLYRLKKVIYFRAVLGMCRKP
jgi:hypothetical protein